MPVQGLDYYKSAVDSLEVNVDDDSLLAVARETLNLAYFTKAGACLVHSFKRLCASRDQGS